MPNRADADAKGRVRRQYASVGDAYVRSVGHATGSDLERMVHLATPAPTDVLLDLATGGGHVTNVFAPHVAMVIASDLTLEILVHARAHLSGVGLERVAYLVADAEGIPLRDGSCDIVACRIAPHHFPDPGRFVLESARVLRPGGRFVLVDSTVPEGEAGGFFNQFEKLRDPSHVRSLTVSEWQALIAAAGLTMTAQESFRKRHDFVDWTTRSRVAPDARADLQRMMLEADPAISALFEIEVVGSDGRGGVRSGESGLVAFSDTKTLFVATSQRRPSQCGTRLGKS